MLKVNNKDTRKTSVSLLLTFSIFLNFFSVSIAGFEQVHACWEVEHKWTRLTSILSLTVIFEQNSVYVFFYLCNFGMHFQMSALLTLVTTSNTSVHRISNQNFLAVFVIPVTVSEIYHDFQQFYRQKQLLFAEFKVMIQTENQMESWFLIFNNVNTSQGKVRSNRHYKH